MNVCVSFYGFDVYSSYVCELNDGRHNKEPPPLALLLRPKLFSFE